MEIQRAPEPRSGSFITNGESQSLKIPGQEIAVLFNNHLELLRALLGECDACLLESPFLYKDFGPLVQGLKLTGKSVELISTCAARGEDQLDKPYVDSFALTADRYGEVVRNLGKHVTKSELSTEERELVRAMLGGCGLVFSRDDRVGARFDWAGLAQTEQSLINQRVRIGSGGRI